MPITSDDIVSALSAAGADTPEKLVALVAQLNLTSQIRVLDAQISSLDAQQDLALAPLQNKRVELSNQKDALVLQLTPKP